MWDTMILKALNDFIKWEDVQRKIEWDIKENTALNIVHNFLKDGHLDEEMQSLIWMNHNFYRFIYSTMIHIIYLNTKEIHIQECFLEKYNERERNAHGGWLNGIPSVDQYKCFRLPICQVLHYSPLLEDEVVEAKKIDVAQLSEKEKKDILKKQKLTLEKDLLKRKIEEMDAAKKQLKLAQKDLKSKRITKM